MGNLTRETWEQAIDLAARAAWETERAFAAVMGRGKNAPWDQATEAEREGARLMVESVIDDPRVEIGHLNKATILLALEESGVFAPIPVPTEAPG